jgi:hypothetical protein
MTLQGFETLACVDIPQTNGLIITTTGKDMAA